MEHGVPADLLDRTLAAGREEIKHAKMAFALARTWSSQPFRISGLDGQLGMIGGRGLADLAERTVTEACIGETQAVLQAALALRFTSRDGPVGEYFQVVLSEEQRHAELAWATVQWSLFKAHADGGEARATDVAAKVSEAIASAVALLRARTETTLNRKGSLNENSGTLVRLRKFGILTPRLTAVSTQLAISLIMQLQDQFASGAANMNQALRTFEKSVHRLFDRAIFKVEKFPDNLVSMTEMNLDELKDQVTV